MLSFNLRKHGDLLKRSKANLAHVSPANQFPTGIVMPVSRRMEILEAALRGMFGQIVRAKGIVKAGPVWLRFDIAGGRYSIEGLGEAESQGARPECVFIGRAIDMVALRMMMQTQLPGFEPPRRRASENGRFPLVFPGKN